MNKTTIIAFIAFVFCAKQPSASAAAADSTGPVWQVQHVFEGRFSVSLPGELRLKTDTIDAPLGRMAYHTYLYQPPQKNADILVYMVSYCDYPAGALPADSVEMIEEFFDATIDAAAASVEGTVIYSAPINIQGYPGRIWRIQYLNDKAVIKTKAVLAGNRFYSVQVACLREKSLHYSVDKFLDSFQIFDP